VEAGDAAPVILNVKGPRMFTGSEVDRMVAVGLVARRAHTIAAMDETEPAPELERQAVVRLRQKPLIGRGLLTACILMGVVALWAAIFLLGLTQVLAGDPMTKTAPPSFFPASAATTGSDAALAAAGAPPGAMPKNGLLPAGVGGEISGVVTARSDKQPAGRITVQAYRRAPGGLVPVSSAASQTDGTYSLGGLYPTRYLLKFSADGYRPVWYPSAPAKAGARPVGVAAQGKTEGINVVVQGEPATIVGTIDPGASLSPVSTTVVARITGDATVVARASVHGTAYTLRNLPAPATYELSFTTSGYQTTKVLTTVNGGATREQPTVVLDAAAGAISGTVTDGTAPLGGVTISTSVAGQDVSVITPTTGAVGAYTLGNLPTPGTYTLTFSSPDHGTRAVIVDLDAGQAQRRVDVKLVAGTGSVTGVVRDADGHPLGGVSVVVGGSVLSGGSLDTGSVPSTLPATTTLTSGSVGSFSISGLQAPGDYTLTFRLDGYAPETVPVSLRSRGAPPTVKVTLGTELGGISGTVTGPGGQPYVGATVTATNGTRSWTTTSSSPGGVLSGGGYLFGAMEPGTYSVTVTASGIQQRTGIVTVLPGETAHQDFTLRAAD
jgi:hypothetical protein